MRLLVIALALAAVVALAACGDDDDNDSATASTSGATVQMDGDTLVDAQGAPLYTSEQEADGRVRCTDACAEIWLPLTAANPTAGDDVSGELGVVRRPDGARQVTYEGVPVYSFADDSPGEVTGDGLSDTFGGREFTWHVIGDAGVDDGSDDSGNGGSPY